MTCGLTNVSTKLGEPQIGLPPLEVLREDLGGTYGVNVSGQFSRLPRGRYALSISFGCAPENVGTLIHSSDAELEVFRREGPAESVLEKIREARRREGGGDAGCAVGVLGPASADST